MKNTNFKLNKTKLIARLMLVVILGMSVVVLSSCMPNIKKGQYYSSGNPDIGTDIMVVIDENNIDIDDWYVDVYIGLRRKKHSLIEWLLTDKEALLRETTEISKVPDFNSNIYYIVSIANRNAFSEQFVHFDLSKAYILKEISNAESLENGNYNYTELPIVSGYYYNYCERFMIPKDFILDTLNIEKNHNCYFCLTVVEKDPLTGEYIVISSDEKASFVFYRTEDGRIGIAGRILKYE